MADSVGRLPSTRFSSPFIPWDRVRTYQLDQANSCTANRNSLSLRLFDVFLRTWHLGATSFGGPPVHYAIIHRQFVEEHNGYAPWLDERTYQDVFALSQALPGPASTKMLFVSVYLRAGLLPAIMAFFLWSLPGASVMLLLAVGVSRIDNYLPGPVYALLSGLNAAAVGIIALAAIGLARTTIYDRFTRILLISGACAGICYTSLWYFPVLIGTGGLLATIWYLWLNRWIGKTKARWDRRTRGHNDAPVAEESGDIIPLQHATESSTLAQRRVNTASSIHSQDQSSRADHVSIGTGSGPQTPDLSRDCYAIPIWVGLVIIVVFFATFASIIATRSSLSDKPLAFELFSNMFLAGTVIVGGGPVVIPLLRDYAVDPGWVSSRDFLIGLAVIQALPGPNFNFAVYLGALALKNSNLPLPIGGIVGFVGIFVPGLVLTFGVQGLWGRLRTRATVASALRGVNAIAVGMIFTAVYRLWEIGYVKLGSGRGESLADEPWWVVVAVVAFSGTSWFNIPAPIAIISGGVLGLCWYGIVGRHKI